MAQTAPPNDEIFMKTYDPVITRRIIGFSKPYLWNIFAAFILMLISSAAAAYAPYFMHLAIDQGLTARNWDRLQQIIWIYLATAVVQAAGTYFRVYIMARVGKSIIVDIRVRLFQHLQNLSLSFFNHFSVGRVITRVVNDVGVLREFISWAFLAVARDLFTLIFIVGAMIAMNARLSLLTFLVLPLMILTTVFFRKKARENYRKVRSAISWVNSNLAENINGVRVVQAFSRQDYNFAHFRDSVNLNNLSANLNAAKIAAGYPSVIDFLGTTSVAVVVWLGGIAVLGGPSVIGTITAGELVAFILYIDRFFEPIRDLSQRYDSFQSAMAAGERIFDLMDAPIEVQDAPEARPLPTIQGKVDFNQVSFHYSDDATLVLKNIDLHIRSGETVALVGETGSGKSTMVKLVSRFIDPTEGAVLIDGFDLRQVTQASLRSQMGVVLQDPFLFNGNALENIRFGRLDASDADVINAARSVGAHEFISNLPNGYQTSVGEGGISLSVGQRQLISFARALLAQPRILILDEATSSIDTQTEIIIQKALAQLLEGRTAFVIAHRLSTVVNADRIVVIQDGRIVEQGTHSELLAKGGFYYNLYKTGFDEPSQ